MEVIKAVTTLEYRLQLKGDKLDHMLACGRYGNNKSTAPECPVTS